ncbi:MAG: transcriptional regulator PpsR [Rhodopila sp.]
MTHYVNASVTVAQEGKINTAVIPGVSIAQPDVTLLLDLDGVIQGVTLSNDISNEVVDEWRGRPWFETVADMGGSKVLRMVEDARESGVSAYRQVNQRFPSGLELPMEYTTVRLGANEGLIAVGRSLRAVAELQARLIAAQQAMEQDYWKLREVETRYRLLFDASNEAVILLNADTLRIVEANPAAIRALGLARGRDLLPEIVPDEREPFQAMLQRVRQNGRAPGALIHLGPEQVGWIARASMMTGEPGPMFMVQLSLADSNQATASQLEQTALDEFVDRLPDAFVVVDRDGIVRRANRAFLDLVQVGAEGAVLGERLGRWLSRPGADLSVLLANLNRHGAVRLFATSIYGDLGGETEVEISAVGNPGGRAAYIALLIRDVGRRLLSNEATTNVQAALAAIIEQTGKTSLRVLVRDAVGLVERHYIDAALQLSNGNRTAAAEILGLSRQGFYKKLAQYEMEGHSRASADADE